MSNRAVSYDSDKVQATAESGLPAVDRYLDQAIKVKRLIAKYIKIKSRIIDEIQGMRDSRHVMFLYLRFVQCMRMDDIAKRMNYSVDGLYKLQRDAIRTFGSVYASKIRSRERRQTKADG